MATDNEVEQPAVLRVAGRPIAAHLRASAPDLTRSVVARLMAELPTYAELPQEELVGDISDIVHLSLRLLADVLERREPPGDHELTRQRDSAAQRAEEGVPLDAILSAYQIGMAMSWQEMTAGAQPSDVDDIQRALTLLMDLQRRLLSAVSAAYLETRRILDSEEHAGRHALMTALLAGEPLDQVSGRSGLRAAPRYVVMALAFTPHPDEAEPGPRARIAARRKVRRIQSIVDRFADEPMLAALDGAGGTVLLPRATPPPWADLCEMIADAAKAADTTITGAAAITEPAGIPAAVVQTSEVMDVVRRTSRAPGLYRLADVLLDYQLSRPSLALGDLAELLRPLEDKPDLLRTLELYLAHDLDRRATGAAMHLHPNTVAYRIRRIAKLIGLDPARTADLRLVYAALTAYRSLVTRPDLTPHVPIPASQE
jgi:hypothetical protein